MEIGSNKSQSNPYNPSESDLVIHLRQDGVLAVVAKHQDNDLSEIFGKSWLATDNFHSISQNLETFLSDHEIDTHSFASITFCVSAPRFTLIPDILYEQGAGAGILANTCRLMNNDRVFSDFLSHSDAVLIYALADSFHEGLQGANQNVRIIHFGYAFNSLATKMSNTATDLFLASISDSFAELMIFRNNRLIFYNQFPHDVPEDLLYYILFVLEQNRILAPEVNLQIVNQTDNNLSSLKKLLSTYIGSVEEISYKVNPRYIHKFSQTDIRKAAPLLESR